MGSGIAVVAACAGWEAEVVCRSRDGLERCEDKLSVAQETLEDAGVDAGWRDRISIAAGKETSSADLVVEAIVEDADTKRQAITQLQRRHPQATVWSTTSALPPSVLSVGIPQPDQFIVAHFANPAYLVTVVEVVPGLQTAVQVIDQCGRLLEEWGKRPVLVRKEVQGFVFNRLQYALVREAVALVRDGVISPEDLETIVKHGYGLRLPAVGALGMVDLTGVDRYAQAARNIWPYLDNSAVPTVFEEMAREGKTFMGWSPQERDRVASELRHLLLNGLVEQARAPSE